SRFSKGNIGSGKDLVTSGRIRGRHRRRFGNAIDRFRRNARRLVNRSESWPLRKSSERIAACGGLLLGAAEPMSRYADTSDPRVQRRRAREGRGQNEGSRYKPALTVRDVPSRGLSSRLTGWKTNRVHHL